MLLHTRLTKETREEGRKGGKGDPGWGFWLCVCVRVRESVYVCFLYALWLTQIPVLRDQSKCRHCIGYEGLK